MLVGIERTALTLLSSRATSGHADRRVFSRYVLKYTLSDSRKRSETQAPDGDERAGPMALLRKRTKERQQYVTLYDVSCPYCHEEMRAPTGVVRCPNCHGKLTVFPDERPGRAIVAQRNSTSGDLERLARMHDTGVLSDESFAAAKQRLLS